MSTALEITLALIRNDIEIPALANQSDEVSIKKTKLLEMAKAGLPRPRHGKDELGKVLSDYTKEKSETYDAKFAKKIRKLRPDWFVWQRDLASGRKAKLLEMAKAEMPRPRKGKDELGYALLGYTKKTSRSYDPDFDKLIRREGLRWFQNTTIEKKARLLAMARAGERKPSPKDKLGKVLANYTYRGSRSYDPDFDKEIRASSTWFKRTA